MTLTSTGGTKTPKVTIVAKSAGTSKATIQGKNDSGSVKDTWTLTVTVLAPNQTLDVDLCVDDTVLFGQRQGTQYRWKNMSANTAVATVSQTSYTDNNVNNCDAMIEAIAVGKTAVMAGWYKRSGSGGQYVYTLIGYTLYNVTVGAAREVKLGGTTDAVCRTPVTGTAWSKTDDTNGRATVALSTTTSSAEETTATITGAKEGDATVTVSDYNNGSSAKTGATYTLKLTVSDPRAKHNEAITVVKGGKTAVTATSEGASAWGISSADTTIATVDPTTVAATESAKFDVAGVKVGDTTVAATNAAAIWNYAVTVYDTNTVALVVTNGAPRTVTCTSEEAATWSVASSDTGVATVSGSSATATINATVTGVAPGDAVVTVSNKYQITTVNVRVVEVKEDEKEIPLSGGGTVECESPVKAKWTAKYDDTVIKSVDLKSLDDLVKVFALGATKDGPVANKVEVTVEPKEGLADGTETEVLVSNGYTTYTLKLTITKPTETKSLPISCGAAQTNELEGVKADYEVDSEDPAIAAVEIVELEDTTNLVITAIKNGNTKVTVDGPTKTVVYEVIVSTVEIEKTVKPSATKGDWSNATIRVAAHIDYVKNTHTNNILYLGSTCTSHTLDTGKIAATLNTLKSKGNVQWALFGVYQSEATSPSQTGMLKMGQADIRSQDITGGTAGTGGSRHRNLRAYLNYLNTNLDDVHEKFDYVVLSFDGGRLAIDYSSDNPTLNASVAQKLDWYYKNDRVIWITDSAAPATGQDRDEYEQFRDTYYRPANTHDDGFITASSTWEAMVAMLDPETYLTKPAGSRYTYTTTSTGAHPGTTIWALRRLESQASYADNDKVLDLLNEQIKDVSYNSEVKDKVVTSVGDSLTIPAGANKVRFYTWEGATAPANPWADQAKNNTHWKLVTPSPVEIGENNQITVVTSNLAENAYMLLEIDVLAKEDLIEKAKQVGEPLCKWDDVNQVWVIDPNDGEATLSLSRNVEGEEPQLYAKGSGATLTKWNIPAQPIVITATDYFDVYDGEAHTIDFTVNPAKNPDTLKETQVRFSKDNSTWSVWTNYTDRAEIWPTWTDCCTSNKVYIEARCVPGYADTNALAYVTITQRVVRIQAKDATKTYDGKPLTNNTFTVLSGFVPGEGFADNKTTMSASSTRTDAGTSDNEITKVGGSYQLNYKSNTKASNYTIETVKGTLTVNKRPIQATAQPVEKVYDGNPTGIVVTVSNVIDADKAKIQKNFAPENSFVDVVGDEAATTVECTVEVDDNYTPITVSATVKITRRPVTLSTSSVNVTVPHDQIATFTEDKIVDATAGQKNKGYVTGEKFTYSNLAKNSTPGTTIAATFDYAANATILANNYTVSRTYGKLTVQPIPPPPHSPCTPEEPEPVDVARVYQVQMNVYTTKGVVQTVDTVIGSACVPGETACLVKRGKDKTVLRGYVYVCERMCELAGYSAIFADVRRRAFIEDAAFTWDFMNIMGVHNTDAECAWTFEGEVAYDELRAQKYALRGAGYGTFSKSALGFNDMRGYFAGVASASYDLKSKLVAGAEEGDIPCNCQPSQVLFCDTIGELDYDAEDTVAFGAWKMKYNQNATNAYLKNGKAIFPSLLRKMFK